MAYIQFTRKGYGRIYVDKAEDIEKVREEIREMDEFEYEYLPSKLITTFDNYPELCFTHKFDSLDLNLLTARLWKKGIMIFCLDNGLLEFMPDEDANKDTD